jgi:hypothetical protein
MIRLKTLGGLPILREGIPTEGAGARRRLARENILGLLKEELILETTDLRLNQEYLSSDLEDLERAITRG